MTNTHTPGPWAVSGYRIDAPIGTIATVCDAGDDDSEGASNARLIAAAPAMLEALRGVMKWWAESYPPKGADDEMPPHLFDAAHTAIRAALGEPEDDDYQPFWRCPDCGREYDDIDDGPCPADDCPSRDDTGDDDGPLEPDEYSDEAADAAEDKWLAARAAPYER